MPYVMADSGDVREPRAPLNMCRDPAACEALGMSRDQTPGVIAFQNPIEPDAPPIAVDVELELLAADDGGLRQSIKLPTPSLVFRDLDVEVILGYTAKIEHDQLRELAPGTAARARAVFIGVPATKVWVGRKFALWAGRDVGTALVLAISPS